MLPARFEEPANFKWGSFSDAGGANIRYGSLQPAGEPKGTIVLAPGFREPIEKYFEIIRDMTDRGFAVWMMDWHGQGGSDRFIKDHPQRMHNEGYGEHIATLHQFATDIVKKSSGPLILSGHSMGAHIGLRYLKEHEGVFDSAVFTSPMCDIQTPGYPRSVAVMLARGARATRSLSKYVPKGHDWDEKTDGDFATNDLTSDPARFGVLADIYKRKPELKMGEPTFGWVLRTFESIDVLRKEDYLKAIKTPVLIGISGNDQIVVAAATERACGILLNCTRMDIPEAKHEIWMERDALRAPWLAKVGAFLEERLGQQKPAPKKANGNNLYRPPRMG
jgi:lysophospholipase